MGGGSRVIFGRQSISAFRHIYVPLIKGIDILKFTKVLTVWVPIETTNFATKPGTKAELVICKQST